MSTRDRSVDQFLDNSQYNLPGIWLSQKLDMSIEYLRIFAYTQCAKLLEWQWFWCLCLPESVEGAKSGTLVFPGRTIVVTKPVSRECTKLIQIGHWKRQPGEWVSFDLTVSSIANEGAFTEPFATFATVMVSATSSLKLGWLRKHLNNLGGERSTRPSGAFGCRWVLPVQWNTNCSSRGGGLWCIANLPLFALQVVR